MRSPVPCGFGSALACVGTLTASSLAQPCDGWIRRVVPGPDARGFHGMAFDAARGVVVVMGGTNDNRWHDTWAWDSTQWRLVSHGDLPGFRHGCPIVFDSRRAKSMLYGGFHTDCPNCGFFSQEVLTWNGAAWTLDPQPGPGQRAYHAMVYDAARDRVVMFGGLYEEPYGWTGPVNDLWEWDGSAWSQRHIPGPSPRAGHTMVYDSLRRVAVMFGGFDGDGISNQETWQFDGQSWTLVATSGPAARGLYAMAFDERRGKIVVFGGVDSTTSTIPAIRFDDTWEWDGSVWTPIALQGPSAREGAGMVYDSVRGVMVLFGGAFSFTSASDETWELCLRDPCPADCDTSTGFEVLDIFDFLCFQNRFAAGSAYACDCDTSSGPGVCDILDFLCFQNQFAAGCP